MWSSCKVFFLCELTHQLRFKVAPKLECLTLSLVLTEEMEEEAFENSRKQKSFDQYARDRGFLPNMRSIHLRFIDDGAYEQEAGQRITASLVFVDLIMRMFNAVSIEVEDVDMNSTEREGDYLAFTAIMVLVILPLTKLRRLVVRMRVTIEAAKKLYEYLGRGRVEDGYVPLREIEVHGRCFKTLKHWTKESQQARSYPMRCGWDLHSLIRCCISRRIKFFVQHLQLSLGFVPSSYIVPYARNVKDTHGFNHSRLLHIFNAESNKILSSFEFPNLTKLMITLTSNKDFILTSVPNLRDICISFQERIKIRRMHIVAPKLVSFALGTIIEQVVTLDEYPGWEVASPIDQYSLRPYHGLVTTLELSSRELKRLEITSVEILIVASPIEKLTILKCLKKLAYWNYGASALRDIRLPLTSTLNSLSLHLREFDRIGESLKEFDVKSLEFECMHACMSDSLFSMLNTLSVSELTLHLRMSTSFSVTHWCHVSYVTSLILKVTIHPLIANKALLRVPLSEMARLLPYVQKFEYNDAEFSFENEEFMDEFATALVAWKDLNELHWLMGTVRDQDEILIIQTLEMINEKLKVLELKTSGRTTFLKRKKAKGRGRREYEHIHAVWKVPYCPNLTNLVFRGSGSEIIFEDIAPKLIELTSTTRCIQVESIRFLPNLRHLRSALSILTIKEVGMLEKEGFKIDMEKIKCLIEFCPKLESLGLYTKIDTFNMLYLIKANLLPGVTIYRCLNKSLAH